MDGVGAGGVGGGGENTHGKRYFLHRSHETLSADTIIHCNLHWRHRRHLFVAFITRIGSVGGDSGGYWGDMEICVQIP